jgi:hypothetical protein
MNEDEEEIGGNNRLLITIEKRDKEIMEFGTKRYRIIMKEEQNIIASHSILCESRGGPRAWSKEHMGSGRE